MFTLIGLIVAIFAICKMNIGGQDTVEGWWGASPIQRRWKVNPSVSKPGSKAQVATASNFLGPLNDGSFVKRPQFQALMSPRFQNVDFGANIRYNMPDADNMAAAPGCSSRQFGDMAQENYKGSPSVENFNEKYQTSCGAGSCAGGCAPSCGKMGMPVSFAAGGPATKPGYADGNYNAQLQAAYSGSAMPEATDSLPVGTMTTMDAEGNVTEPVVYQNFIFANMRSRLRALGDPIRGDLAIAPCEGNWFSVHPNVNLDLQEGAMNVMGGVTNETNRTLAQMIYEASGNADTMIGGVNLAEVNMIPQYTGQYMDLNNTVQISGMP